MEIKTINSQLVYCKEFETTLKEIEQYVGETPNKMLEEVMEAGGKIAGPQVWEYEGADGNPETRFKLTIALPIEQSIESLSKNIKILPEFNCTVKVHNGSWDELSQIYQGIMTEIMQDGKTPGQICREIYHTVDFENPAKNVTEIQMQLN